MSLRDRFKIKMYGLCPVLLHQSSATMLVSNLFVAWRWLCNPFGVILQQRQRRWVNTGPYTNDNFKSKGKFLELLAFEGKTEVFLYSFNIKTVKLRQ